MIDLDRIKVKGGTISNPEMNTKRTFVTPWDSIRFYQKFIPTGITDTRLFRIQQAPKRYRVSIGAVFASIWYEGNGELGVPNTNSAMVMVWVLDGRKIPASILTETADCVHYLWMGNPTPDTQAIGPVLASSIQLVAFPDGILLPRDIQPVIRVAWFGLHDQSFSLVYRYEEWS